MSLVKVRDLRLSFRVDGESLSVLRGVDFELASGEVMGLVGESGSGKSLTGLSLMGLAGANARVSAGALEVCGTDVLHAAPGAMRALRGREVAMVFQNPSTSLAPHLRIGTQLEEYLRSCGGLSRTAARSRSLALLQNAGLSDASRVVRLFPHALSGGMNQRVMIAMALALEPRLLIADEPTTALDVTTQQKILALFREQVRGGGTAMLFISHDLGVVRSLCDTVAVMYAGRIVEQGPADRVLAAPRHPYTRALLAARPALHGPKEALTGIPGRPPAAGEETPGCAFAPRCPLVIPDCTTTIPPAGGTGAHVAACLVQNGKAEA